MPSYDTFWFARGTKEYQFLYHKTVRQELSDIFMYAGIAPDSKEAIEVTESCMQEIHHQAGLHFAQPYFNTATVAGLLRMLLKSLAQKYEVPFPIPAENESAPQTPWWAE